MTSKGMNHRNQSRSAYFRDSRMKRNNRHVGQLPRQNKPRKAITAKKLHEKKEFSEKISVKKEQNQILREKPKLRGWFHLVFFPIATAASIVLICLAPSGYMKVGVSIYTATVILLFGNSAALHIGHGYWPPKVDRVLTLIDYSNIFLIIAGTCTPFLFALDNWSVCWTYFGILWGAAVIGTVCHLMWPEGLDWLFTIIYCVMGLAPATIIALFWRSKYIGPVPTILVLAGGACYIAGAVCFALRKPNPFPKWFGYHEIFHLGTIAGYSCHVVALFITVVQMRAALGR